MNTSCKKSEIELKSYAKINLALDVTGVREDGYHGVTTIMQRVSLADTIRLQWIASENHSQPVCIALTTNKPYLPTDERNLAYKAAQVMVREAEAAGKAKHGTLRIHIEKRIPVAAGLGGGSGNCAAVLIALNRMWRLGFHTKKLCELAETMGTDIPFCVLVQNTKYRCALGTGRGEKLQALRYPLRKHVVIAKPAFGVSTKEVFAGIDSCEFPQRPDFEQLQNALTLHRNTEVYQNMINVLENYTLPNYPKVRELKEKIAATDGVRKVMMSGSGPSVIGFYDTYWAAKSACAEIRKAGFEAYWADTER